ncbi:MAG: hypothetical protein ACI97A_003362 [Planctomycetota bacterium]|jgi:hypothetical protein
MKSTSYVFVVLFMASLTSFGQFGLPEGPSWGRGIAPESANSVFATADGCARCHSASSEAVAMRSANGADISPHSMWQTSMMANSFRDPYWRAQVSKATLAHPESAAKIEKLCTTCHAPMVSHTARLGGFEPPRLHDMVGKGLAEDGVSCTVCHQARPDNFGKDISFNGNLDIRTGRIIYGPYPEPANGPMQMFARFTPTHGPHIKSSGLCGSCHTLETHHAIGAEAFPEQTPYLEWLNSDFADGGKNAKSCQQCHMPDYGDVRVVRAPNGGDFNVKARPNYRGHAFFGGNAYMLDILAANREKLGVTAPVQALKQAAIATRKQLADSTAKTTVMNARFEDNRLRFDVKVENRTGHKLPSGYPSRRIWLAVEVNQGRERVFLSGGYEEDGRLTDVKEPLGLPHVDVVTKSTQIPVWETVVFDAKGKPTTELVAMARYAKDNRLLPMGWRADGPYAKKTKPVGIGGDKDFIAGSDVVHYDLDLGQRDPSNMVIIARLFYQTIPPAWANDLKDVPSPEAKLFTTIYQSMPTATEILSLALKRVN